MRTLTDYKGLREEEHIVVCGLGSSINELDVEWLKKQITIGVNDISRLFTPTYLVLLDQELRFTEERWKYIKESECNNIFTQLRANQIPSINPCRLIQINCSSLRSTVDINDINNIVPSYTSPFVAIQIAYWMGAKRIDLIGVDFTPNHFYNQSGDHALNARLPQIKEDFSNLYKALKAKGVELNLITNNSELKEVLPVRSI